MICNMKKPARTTNQIHDLLTDRRSPRAFSEQMVEGGKIVAMLDYASWSPSTYNEQPWNCSAPVFSRLN
jgi:nitroreductase